MRGIARKLIYTTFMSVWLCGWCDSGLELFCTSGCWHLMIVSACLRTTLETDPEGGPILQNYFAVPDTLRQYYKLYGVCSIGPCCCCCTTVSQYNTKMFRLERERESKFQLRLVSFLQFTIFRLKMKITDFGFRQRANNLDVTSSGKMFCMWRVRRHVANVAFFFFIEVPNDVVTVENHVSQDSLKR